MLFTDYIQDYNKVIAINPKVGAAYYNRGLINISIGAKDSAIEDFKKAEVLGMPNALAEINKVNSNICKECNGSGLISLQHACINCKGMGQMTCVNCEGKGGNACSSCHGTGIWPQSLSWGNGQSCTTCKGTGKTSNCKLCAGKGLVKCDICNGKKIAISEELCPKCKGSGKFTANIN